jgi:hypothetical protein
MQNSIPSTKLARYEVWLRHLGITVLNKNKEWFSRNSEYNDPTLHIQLFL